MLLTVFTYFSFFVQVNCRIAGLRVKNCPELPKIFQIHAVFYFKFLKKIVKNKSKSIKIKFFNNVGYKIKK